MLMKLYDNKVEELFNNNNPDDDTEILIFKAAGSVLSLLTSIGISSSIFGLNGISLTIGLITGILLTLLHLKLFNQAIEDYINMKDSITKPLLEASGISNWEIENIQDIDGDGTYDEIMFSHIKGKPFNVSELESAIDKLSPMLNKEGGIVIPFGKENYMLSFKPHIINLIINEGGIYNFIILNEDEIVNNPYNFEKIVFQHNTNTIYDIRQLKESKENITKAIDRGGISIVELDDGCVEMRFNNLVHKILKAGNISSWKISNVEELIQNEDYNLIKWEHIEGESYSAKELEGKGEDLASLLGKGRSVIKDNKNGRVDMVFKPELVSRKDNIPFQKINLPKNKLYLGVKNKTDKAFTQPEDEILGGFTQHMLIIGKSGSGKSFFTDNVLMGNWMNTTNYNDIEKIYIIDYKNSGDYLKYKDLDKVEYSDGSIESASIIMKKVVDTMLARYAYQVENGGGGYKGKKILLISDEIQRVNPSVASSERGIIRNSWMEIEKSYQMLSEQARAANISLISILQKGTLDNLPGGSNFRDNNRHRIGLLNNNMSLLFDQELIDKEGIKADKFKQGQFVYMDELLGEDSITESYGVALDQPWTDYVISSAKRDIISKKINELKTLQFEDKYDDDNRTELPKLNDSELETIKKKISKVDLLKAKEDELSFEDKYAKIESSMSKLDIELVSEAIKKIETETNNIRFNTTQEDKHEVIRRKTEELKSEILDNDNQIRLFNAKETLKKKSEEVINQTNIYNNNLEDEIKEKRIKLYEKELLLKTPEEKAKTILKLEKELDQINNSKQIITDLNNIKHTDEEVKIINQVNMLEEISPIVNALKKDYQQELENAGIKTFSELKGEKVRDFVKEAIEIYKKEKEKENTKKDEKLEKYEKYKKEELPDQIKNAKIRNEITLYNPNDLPDNFDDTFDLDDMIDTIKDKYKTPNKVITTENGTEITVVNELIDTEIVEDEMETTILNMRKETEYKVNLINTLLSELYSQVFAQEIEEKQKGIDNNLQFLLELDIE